MSSLQIADERFGLRMLDKSIAEKLGYKGVHMVYEGIDSLMGVQPGQDSYSFVPMFSSNDEDAVKCLSYISKIGWKFSLGNQDGDYICTLTSHNLLKDKVEFSKSAKTIALAICLALADIG
jgi:hypothetical protein